MFRGIIPWLFESIRSVRLGIWFRIVYWYWRPNACGNQPEVLQCFGLHSLWNSYYYYFLFCSARSWRSYDNTHTAHLHSIYWECWEEQKKTFVVVVVCYNVKNKMFDSLIINKCEITLTNIYSIHLTNWFNTLTWSNQSTDSTWTRNNKNEEEKKAVSFF